MRRILLLWVVLLLSASMAMAQEGPLSAPVAEPKQEPEPTAPSEPTVLDRLRGSVPEPEQEEPESQRHALLQVIDSKGGISFHKDMFITPLTYNERFTGNDSETVFQLSLKARIVGGPFFFGYSQRSFWQAYNSKESAPFRETNYNPEFFFRSQPGNWLSSQWGFDLGLEHESNGKRNPESRSWNKLYAVAFHEGEDDIIWLKTWYRLPEDNKEDPMSAEGDDNPDIGDYYGHSEVRYRRCLDGQLCQHLFTGMVRGSLGTGRGAIELSWSFPTGSEQTSWYVYLFSGYGESLIDYNESENRVAIGVTLRPR